MKLFRFGALGFIVIGLILAGISVFVLTRPKVDYRTCEGTIVKIEERDEYVGDELTREYKVFIDYEADGKEYKEVEYGAYDSSMDEGDTVTVYYDPADPSRIQPEGFEKVPYVVLAAGIVSVAAGVVMLIRKKA